MNVTSIIIPTCNGIDLLKECIDSIRNYTLVPFEIIIVDNGSTDGTVNYCIQERLRLISIPRNLGFPVACNYGLNIASGNSLLLLNNDIVVTHGWLSNMLTCLYSSDDIGIVGPTANYVSGKQLSADIQYESLAQLHLMAVQRNALDHEKWQQVDRLVGFCFLMKREVFSRVGFLDERFSPGHYEDDDYCFRARMSGYRLMLSGDVFIHHHGNKSFRQLGQEQVDHLVAQNYGKFVEKWGIDPHQFI